jgi:Zn-dependent protease with chaperone function
VSITPLIKTPAGVQFNRAAFTIYAVLFGGPMWSFRHIMVLSGWAIFGSFVFCSLLGFAYTFIRLRRSRWILAVLDLAIPAAFWTLMCITEFSRPAWWAWPFAIVFALVVWFGIPTALAILLFKDQKTNAYFATSD